MTQLIILDEDNYQLAHLVERMQTREEWEKAKTQQTIRKLRESSHPEFREGIENIIASLNSLAQAPVKTYRLQGYGDKINVGTISLISSQEIESPNTRVRNDGWGNPAYKHGIELALDQGRALSADYTALSNFPRDKRVEKITANFYRAVK